MDAHRVEVFDRTNHHAVVRPVAHDLHLELFPAEQRFFDENFGDRRQVEPALGHFVEFLAVVSNAAAGATQREGGADDERKTPNPLGDGARFLQGVSGAADGHVQADGDHQVFEHLAVFAAFDGFGVGSDHFDAVTVERAAAEEGHGGVEGGLAAESWEKDELVGGRSVIRLRLTSTRRLRDP